MIKTELLKRTHQCGDCMEWTGSFVHKVLPAFTLNGKKLYVKRYLAELDGKNVKGRVVTSDCKNKLCVNPAHLVVLTRAQLVNRTAASGAWSTAAVRAKVAHGIRAKSKLSQDAAREIRMSDEPIKVLAARHGITGSYVGMIRAGYCRKDYGSPFAGLGAR
jgi:hypothetical protein